MLHEDHHVLSNEVSATNTMACPACRETIMSSATTCRFCGLPIDAQMAAEANVAQQALNTAIIQANALKYAGPFAALVGVVLVLNASGYVTDDRVVMAWLAPPIALFGSWRWTRRHGTLSTSDAELKQSRRDVHRSKQIWGAVLALEVALLAWVAGWWALTLTMQPN